MAAQTAIDYGARRLRLLEFDGSARKLRVLGLHEVGLDVAVDPAGGQDPNDVRAAAVADAVKESGFVRDPCGMCFNAGSATFREFDLPFANAEQIAKVVRFESEGHFQGDLDDLVVQHLVQRKTRDKSHILAVGVRKDELLDRLDVLEEGGLDPMFVDLDDFALFNALAGTGVLDEHARFVVVHAQELTTSLMFVVDREIAALRAMRIGVHGLVEGTGEPAASDEAAQAREHDFLGRLTREARRTLATLPDLGAPEVVYVTGAGSALPGLAEKLSELLGAPAEELDLLARIDHKLAPEEAARHGRALGPAIGVAFRLAGLDTLRLDFRREEVAYTHKFDQVKAPLIFCALVLFLVVAFHGLDAYKKVDRLESEYAKMTELGGKYLAELMEDQTAADARWRGQPLGPERMGAVLAAARSLREEIAQKLGRSASIPDLQSALAVWIELFETLRRAEDDFLDASLQPHLAFDRIAIDVSDRTPQLKLSGEVEDLSRYQRLEDRLKERPMFRDLKSASTKQNPGGTGLRFTDMTIDLQLSPAEAKGEA